MKKFVVIALAMLMAIAGMAGAEDFIKGEQRGADSRGAAMIDQDRDQDSELKALWNGEFLQLSGVGADIFNSPFFQMDGWALDASGSSLTPSQSAFVKDNPEDGRPLGIAKKAAFVGARNAEADPRAV